MSEALPAGPTVDRSRLLPAPSLDGVGRTARELVAVAEAADGLLAGAGPPDDGHGATGLTSVRVRRQAAAVRDLARDAAASLTAGSQLLVEACAHTERVVARAEVEVARLWQAVSADVASRRSATEAFVARAHRRAEEDAARLLGEAQARADELLGGAEAVVAAWLDDATPEPQPAAENPPAPSPAPSSDERPLDGGRPGRLRRLFTRLVLRRSPSG